MMYKVVWTFTMDYMGWDIIEASEFSIWCHISYFTGTMAECQNYLENKTKKK